ncbi:MAG: hypothetical protein P1U58_19905 [Verrucomicrobiales bacterium]|nr:hypothetical protein [Verrucomicrobiales bacterium]
MTVRFFFLLSCLGFYGIAFSQTDEQKAVVIAAVGEQAGNALISTHGAVNQLPTIREGGVFPEAEVKELATSYRESSELVQRLVGQQPATPDQERIANGMVLFVEQAKAMERMIHDGVMEIPADYTSLQEKVTATLFEMEMAASAGEGSSADKAVKAVAEALRGGMQWARQYQPTPEQVEKIAANEASAAMLKAWAEGVYESIPENASTAKLGQSEVLVTGPDFETLPGGYTKHRENFRDDIKIYGFKYVKPGETSGMAFDGLFEVDGKWVLIPKAWRAFAAPR